MDTTTKYSRAFAPKRYSVSLRKKKRRGKKEKEKKSALDCIKAELKEKKWRADSKPRRAFVETLQDQRRTDKQKMRLAERRHTTHHEIARRTREREQRKLMDPRRLTRPTHQGGVPDDLVRDP